MAVVDCRSLIEFCRAFERHRRMAASSPASSEHHRFHKSKSLNPLSHPFCEHSTFAVVDIVILCLAFGALGVLTVPCFKLIFQESSYLLTFVVAFMEEVIYNAPVAYVSGLIMFVTAIVVWEWVSHQARKCGNPYCKGLKKAVEFDIQLESEECVRYLPPSPTDLLGARPLELGCDHKELEAELKKMAPLNGRTVLIFRLRCGCPAGRMEVWGEKKLRRIKKNMMRKGQFSVTLKEAAK